MKRIVLIATMFTGISNFAADKQASTQSPLQSSQKPSPTILGTICGAPGALMRSLTTSYDETTQRKMFGFDDHENCEEHQRTLKCRDYFITLLNTIPLATPIDQEMKDQRKKRRNIFACLADRILEERERDQIGDQYSAHAITRITRLLECAQVFGSEVFITALTKYQTHVSNNLKQFIPTPSEEENSNDDAS